MLLPLLTCGPHSLFSSFFNSTAQRLPKGSSPCRPLKAQIRIRDTYATNAGPRVRSTSRRTHAHPGPPDQCITEVASTSRGVRRSCGPPRCRSSIVLTAPGTTTHPHGWHIARETASRSSVARLSRQGREPCARAPRQSTGGEGDGRRDEPFPLELNRATRQYSTTTLSISKPLVLLLLPMCGPHSLFSSFFNSTAQRLPKGSSPCRAL